MELISREYVEAELARYAVPGMGIGVIRDGEVLMVSGYGYKDLEEKTRIDGDTLWGIASCSKSFTSAMIGILVTRGILDLDQPVKEYLPDFQMYDETATRQCTLRDMLCHRTGLSGYDDLWTDKNTGNREELWKRLRYLKPNMPFRYKAQYSNLMISMAAHAAEKVTGETYDDLIRNLIFAPLGMDSSGTTLQHLLTAENVITPYWPGKNGPVRIRHWNDDLGAPAGGLSSTLNDMLKWLDFHIHDGVVNGKRLIDHEVMFAIHTAQTRYELWQWHFPENAPVGGYGLCWYNDYYRGHFVYWHLGEIEGSGTMQVVIPDAKLGIIVFNNLHEPDILIQCSVVYTIIDRVLGLPPEDWASRMAEQKGNWGHMLENWDVNLMGKQVRETKPSHAAVDFCGKYYEPGHGYVVILPDGDGIGMEYRGYRQKMKHFHYDVFQVCDIKMDTMVVQAPLTFLTDSDSGKIKGFSWKLYDGVDPVVFRKEE